MKIYVCGACNSGKAEIVRRISEKLKIKSIIDPSETVFQPVFGMGLGRVFRGRRWEGKQPETYQGIMEYLDVLDSDGPFVSNEGPILFLSHLMFFGVLSTFMDLQRQQIVERSLAMTCRGFHVIIERWVPANTFDEVSVLIQKNIAGARDNVIVLKKYKDYGETIEKASRKIVREVKQKWQ